MATLSISEFSCLKEAVLELAPVNVIIGPQGSGKSVTTKLFYFLSDITSNYIQSAERGDTIEDYKKGLARQFRLWFPPSAWGPGRSNINYYAGPFSVRILRRMVRGRVSDEISITFSEWFTNLYQRTLELFERTRSKFENDAQASPAISLELDRNYRAREFITQRVTRELGPDYISQQTFIPAGRAFFTSIGRIVAGFEQAGSLDPITIKFARLFANIRDRNARRSIPAARRLGEEYAARRARFMQTLFGGELKFEDEAEFVEAIDGRRIPFASLSSGQQELLPMWSLMEYFSELDVLRQRSRNSSNPRARELVYIEEPEAHLFPSAQSLLMEFLIGAVASERMNRSLILTTHSPYIMAKLNVFSKAGQLAKRKKRNQDINDIVPRECWLGDGQLSASAIEGGELRNLLDEDGLIDGAYLDDVSEDISRQFSRLLRIESEISSQ